VTRAQTRTRSGVLKKRCQGSCRRELLRVSAAFCRRSTGCFVTIWR
jgi:hypothetical protein